MNIILNRELLLKAISILGLVVPQKTDSRPILSNIEFKVEEKTLHLLSTDLELGLNLKVPLISVFEEGHLLLPTHQLLSILKETTEDEVKLETSEKTARIFGKKFQYKLPLFSADDYPEIPKLEGPEVEIKKDDLKGILNEVSFAMNKDRNRYSLNSLLLCFVDDYLEGVASDQVRLAYSKKKMTEKVGKEEKYILPAKAVQVLSSILNEDIGGKVVMVKGKNQVTFRFNQGYFITRLIEAQFPKYRVAYENFVDVPEIVMNTRELNTAIRQTMLLTCENARNIVFILSDKKITFKVSTPLGQGEVEMFVDDDRTLPPIGINPYFVHDFLREINSQGCEEVRMKVVGPRQPVILSPHENYRYFMSPTSV